MQPSDIFQSDAGMSDHGYHTSFNDWDINGDRVLDYNEVNRWFLIVMNKTENIDSWSP